MLSVTAICDQYAWLYADIPVPPGTWDHIFPVDGAYAAVKRVGSTDYVMFRGSTTFMDWRQDFEDFAVPVHDPVLGLVHPGFRDGALLIKDRIDAVVGDDVIVVGHSLGAGHAALYAGYRMAKGPSRSSPLGLNVQALVLFGEPKAGSDKLCDILQGVDIQSFRNANMAGHDLITDVPFTDIPLLPYRHVRDLTDCRHDPDPLDPWLLFRYHHFYHYCKAFGACGPAVLALK